MARSDDFTFTLVGLEGDTIRVIRRIAEREPISDTEWEEGLTAFGRAAERPGTECDRRGFDRLAEKAAFDRFLLDNQGRLWARTWDGARRFWEVYRPDGRIVARVPSFSLSARTAPAIRDNTLAWISTDEAGFQRVTVATFGPQ